MKNSKKIIQMIKKGLLGIIFLFGFVLIFNRPITNYLIENYHPVIYSNEVRQHSKTGEAHNWKSVKPLNLFTVIKARIYHPQVKVIGSIYNEKLGLNVPIVDGLDQTICAICAGTLEPHEQMGQRNFAITTHNISSSKRALFTPLYQKAKFGDILNVTNFNKVYHYQIYAIKPISEHNNSILVDSSKPHLTLITCTNANQNHHRRFVYQARLIRTTNYNKISISTKAFLNEKYSMKDSRWNVINLSGVQLTNPTK